MPYTKEQIRAFLEHNSGIWPLNFLHAVYGRLGEELLDAWLDSHDEDVVEARLREVAEGMADDNGGGLAHHPDCPCHVTAKAPVAEKKDK